MSIATKAARKEVVQGSVRLRGRLYPMPEAVSQRANAQPPEPKKPAQSSVAKQLKDEISARLPFFQRPESKTVADLTAVYNESLDLLLQFRRDIEELIPPLCEANLHFRQGEGEFAEEAKQKVLAAKLNEMIAKTRFDIRGPRNINSAQLMALPLPEVSAQLRSILMENVERFVEDFFAGLDQLVDRYIAGLVEWTGQTVCQYHFFREVVIQDQTATETSSLGRERSDSSETGWIEHRELTTKGTHTHRFARHEHHTVDAFQTRIDDSKVVIPSAVQKFLAQIPDWLDPIVRVIDGQIRREIVIEWDTKTEAWEIKKEKDVAVSACEPAVVIDHFVLIGWGPRDIETELDRRKKLTHEAETRSAQTQARILAPVSFVLGVCLSALSLWLFAKSTGSLGFSVAFFPLLLTIPCWVTGVDSSLTAKNRPHSPWQPVLVAAGLFTIFAGIGLFAALGLASLMVPVMSLVLIIIGIVLLLFSRPRRLS